MILWVFIDFSGVKVVFTDIYRYFIDMFFQKFQHKRACSTVAVFRWKSVFSDFLFYRFFLCFLFSASAENRFFCNISAKKNDFLFLDHY